MRFDFNLPIESVKCLTVKGVAEVTWGAQVVTLGMFLIPILSKAPVATRTLVVVLPHFLLTLQLGHWTLVTVVSASL